MSISEKESVNDSSTLYKMALSESELLSDSFMLECMDCVWDSDRIWAVFFFLLIGVILDETDLLLNVSFFYFVY